VPIYEIQGPDGKIYEIEGPEGATLDDLVGVINSQTAAPAEPDNSLQQWTGVATPVHC
jgi:hypothetical protein